MTPSIVELIFATVLGLFGLLACFRGLSAWLKLRRLFHPRSRERISAFTRLDGTLHASEPVAALDGSAAVAIQRTIRYAYTVDDALQSSPQRRVTLCSAFEVRRAEGSTPVAPGSCNVIGPYHEHVLSAATCQASHPSLWAELPEEHRQAIKRLFVSETVVRDGARGFVIGEASPGRPVRPVVLSGWDGKTAGDKVLAPASALVWLGLLAWALAALTVAIPWWLAR